MSKIEFDAVPATAKELEDKFINELAGGNGGVARRVAHSILTHSSDHFYNQEMGEKAAEAWLSAIEPLGEYIKMMKVHLEFMEAAQARTFAILQYHSEQSELA